MPADNAKKLDWRIRPIDKTIAGNCLMNSENICLIAIKGHWICFIELKRQQGAYAGLGSACYANDLWDVYECTGWAR